MHPFLGISFVALNPAIAAQQRNQCSGRGPGGAGVTGGRQPQDVITRVDGQVLSSDTDLARAINNHHSGDVLKLSLLRRSQQLTVSITLAERP